MLEALYAKAKPKNLKPTLWKGFVEDLKHPEKYNAIIFFIYLLLIIYFPKNLQYRQYDKNKDLWLQKTQRRSDETVPLFLQIP